MSLGDCEKDVPKAIEAILYSTGLVKYNWLVFVTMVTLFLI